MLKKIISKTTEFILNFFVICIIIILLFAGFYFFQTKIQKKDYANIFGYTAFEVSTGSMNPTLQVGDIIFVKLTDKIKENDIIVFKEEKNFITHRLMQINEDKLITKGDANNSKDKPIEKEQVLGKVVFIGINIGLIRNIIFTPKIFICILISILFFGIAFSLNVADKEKEEEKKEDVW